MKMRKETYWETMLRLWIHREWISGKDYFYATDGSQKFTSRISDMRAKGVEIVSEKRGKYNVYALITPPDEVRRLMSGKRAAA